MSLKFSERIASLLSLLLLFVLAVGTYYLAEKSSEFADTSVRAPADNRPDSFVEGLNLTKVNAKGEPVFRLESKRMEHFPVDNRTEYVDPVLVSLDSERAQVTIRARRGKASNNGDITELFEDVELVRLESPKESRVRVTTQALVLYTLEEVARTALPVKIEYASSVLTGVGLEFNNATRQFSLDASVTGVFPPKQK